MSDYLTRLVARSRESPGVVRPRMGSLFEPPSIETAEAGTAVSGRPVAPSFDAEPATSTVAADQQVDTQSTDITAAGASNIIPTPLPGEAGHLRAESTKSPKDVQGPVAGDPRTAFERRFEETQPTQRSATIVPRTDGHGSDDPLEAMSPNAEDDSTARSVEQSRRSAGTPPRGAETDFVAHAPARTVVPSHRTQTPDSGGSESARTKAFRQSSSAAASTEAEPNMSEVEARTESELAGRLSSSRSVRAEVVAGPAVQEVVPRPGLRSVEPPAIRVTIGRVDVRAVMPPSRPAPLTPHVRPKPALSLEAYLQQRNGELR